MTGRSGLMFCNSVHRTALTSTHPYTADKSGTGYSTGSSTKRRRGICFSSYLILLLYGLPRLHSVAKHRTICTALGTFSFAVGFNLKPTQQSGRHGALLLPSSPSVHHNPFPNIVIIPRCLKMSMNSQTLIVKLPFSMCLSKNVLNRVWHYV